MLKHASGMEARKGWRLERWFRREGPLLPSLAISTGSLEPMWLKKINFCKLPSDCYMCSQPMHAHACVCVHIHVHINNLKKNQHVHGACYEKHCISDSLRWFKTKLSSYGGGRNEFFNLFAVFFNVGLVAYGQM